MIGNSPSANGSVESLIASLQLIIRSGWYSSKTEKEWRSLFVQKVFGDYLQSFQCKCCGSRFIVSKGQNKAYIQYQYICPACHSSLKVKPDDSFLKAMVSEEQLENTYRVEKLLEENNALKPFRILLNLPCEICKQPINEWNEENLEKGIIGVGWAHVKCWETASGKLTQFTRLARAALEIQEKKASNSGPETGS